MLVALRLVQRTRPPETIGSLPEAEIFGDLAPLDADEIDALCERLNSEQIPPAVIVTNATRIAYAVARRDDLHGDIGPNMIEEINAAAAALAVIETAHGFVWNECPKLDWETVCQFIADRIDKSPAESDWVAIIREFVTTAGVARLSGGDA